jgi:hypothetical protein
MAGKPYLEKARQRARAFVQAHKTEMSCLDCGVIYPPYVLDFDHVRGESKKSDMSSLVCKGKSNRLLAEEMAKCDLICANCHRERTHGEKR